MKSFDFNVVTMNSFFHPADVQTISKKNFFGPLKTTGVLCNKKAGLFFHDWHFFFTTYLGSYEKISLQ